MLRLQKFSARFIASESKNPNALGSLIFSNYYKLFNVPYNANKDEIKAAYLIKAKEFHPDRNPEDKNAAENFMKIRDAYNVMRDTNLRQKYDSELLKRGVGQTRAGAMATSQRPSSNTGPAGKIKFKPRVRTFDDGNAESEFDDQHLTFQQKRQFQRDELKKALHEWENMYKESFYSTSGNKNFSNKPPANSNQYQRPNFVNINLSNEQYKNWHNWANMHNKPIADEQKRQKNRFKSLIRAEPRPDDPHEYSLKNAHFRNYKSNYKGSAYLKNDNGSVYFGPGNPVENVTKQKLSYAESYYNDHMENYKSRADPHFKEYWKNVDAMNQQQFDKDLEQQPKASYDPGHRPFDKSKNSFREFIKNTPHVLNQPNYIPRDRELQMEKSLDRVRALKNNNAFSKLEQARKKIGLPKKSLPKSETQPAPKPKTPRVQQHDKKPDQTEQEFWQSVMS